LGELRIYPVLSAGIDRSKYITLDPELGWVSEAAILEPSLSAMSTTGAVLLEWLSTQDQESSKSDTEPKTSF
jgi:hypothetical protein